MADESGGGFGGDGSIRWEIVSGDPSDNDSAGTPAREHDGVVSGAMRRCRGIDRDAGGVFRIILRPRPGETANDLRNALPSLTSIAGNQVVITLPVQDVRNQVQIRWGRPSSGN